MTSTARLLSFLLLGSAVFGQRSGGFGGGSGRSGGPATGHSFPAHPPGTVIGPGTNRGPIRGGSGSVRRGFRNGFTYRRGYGYYAPYYPLWGSDLYSPYYEPPYGDDQYGGDEQLYPGTGYPMMSPGPPSDITGAPRGPATAVIHEYKVDKEQPANVSGERPAFTIVLRDGSTRSAVASWVQDSKLHYVDLRSRQQILLPDVIDRDATERANDRKNLRMELPPG
jgi:hypothetical protein